MVQARDTTVVRCPDCGGTREISVRQKRRITNSNKSLLCSLCRTIPRAAEFGDKDLAFWVDRYPLEWIRETAEMIWGNPR